MQGYSETLDQGLLSQENLCLLEPLRHTDQPSYEERIIIRRWAKTFLW